jgi:hypothetical protein
MRGLLERRIHCLAKDLIVLSPPQVPVPGTFRFQYDDEVRHRELLTDMQRLRGRVYLEDGALKPEQLTWDGRHITAEDSRAWHLLMLDRNRRVMACLWYLEHEPTITIDDLRVRNCPVAHMDEFRQPVRDTVASEIERARRERIAYAEVGGWASERQNGCAPEGLLLILATFGLSRVFGGALGITTATVRHCSATILKRLGLSGVPVGDGVVPAYYDPRYACEMELLRFDTRQADRRYEPLIRDIVAHLPQVRVITPWPAPRYVEAPIGARAIRTTASAFVVGAA